MGSWEPWGGGTEQHAEEHEQQDTGRSTGRSTSRSEADAEEGDGGGTAVGDGDSFSNWQELYDEEGSWWHLLFC